MPFTGAQLVGFKEFQNMSPKKKKMFWEKYMPTADSVRIRHQLGSKGERWKEGFEPTSELTMEQWNEAMQAMAESAPRPQIDASPQDTPVDAWPDNQQLPFAGPPAPIDPMGTGYAGPRTPPGIGNNIPNLGLNLNEAGGPDLSGMQSLIGTLMEQMNMEQPGMPMQDAGTQANPLASMAAVFAASMSDSLTGRRGQTINVQRQLAQHEQNRRQIEKENRSNAEENMRVQQEWKIEKLREINKVKYRMAEEMMDYEKMEKVLRDEMRLDAFETKNATARDLARAEAMGKGQEGKDNAMTAAQESSARKRALDEDKEFWDDENIYDTKGEHGDTVFGWTGLGEVAHRGNLLPEFFEESRRKAIAQVIDSPSHSGGVTGLHRYILTLHQFRNSDGTFKDPGPKGYPPEMKRLVQLGVKVFGSNHAFDQWLFQQGLITPAQAGQ